MSESVSDSEGESVYGEWSTTGELPDGTYLHCNQLIVDDETGDAFVVVKIDTEERTCRVARCYPPIEAERVGFGMKYDLTYKEVVEHGTPCVAPNGEPIWAW